jgi:hypothetical protein
MPSLSAIYSVTGTNTVNGCSYTMVKAITVNPLPLVTASTPSAVCDATMGCLSASGASTYQWAGPCGFTSIQQNPCFPFSGLCLCTYSVTGTDINGCMKTATLCINVISPPGIGASTSNTLLCAGQTATITTSGSASTFTWNTSATGSVIIVSPTVTTSYSVTGTALNGCTNGTSITQSVSACTGFNEELISDAQINIYPNPANSEITIKVDDFKGNSTIEIYNAVGQIVYTGDLKNTEQKINISDLADGIYYIKISEGKMIKGTRKLIKN